MSKKKTNKVNFELETEGGEIAQVPNNKKKPFKIERGGIARPLGNGFYYLQGKSHEDGGIDMTFNTDARIFSSVPFLNGKSPAERVMRGENPDVTFVLQERFKDVNGINDDGSRKAKYGLNNKNMNKNKLGGSTGLIRVQANGKDRLMYVPFTGEETKTSRKKARFGAFGSPITYNNFEDYLAGRSKNYEQYSIIDPSKLTDVQVADIDWMHNNLISTGVDAADRTNYLSGNKGTLYVGQKKTPLSEQQVAREIAGTNYAKNYKINADRFNPVIINPDEIKEIKVSEVTNKQVRQQTRAALKKEGLDWMNRNKDWAAPAIRALGNGLSSWLSYRINKNMLGDMKYVDRPIPKRALPRITKVNKEPELNVVRVNLARNIENTTANVSSSRVANSIISDMGLNATLAMNKIYADKENQERNLLNAKLANDQEIINTNIDAENVWRKGKSDFENAIRDQDSENAVLLVDNINKGIQTGITDAERRRQFRNNLAIMAAAYPNVTPALLRSYGADFLRMGGKVKLNKKK